MQEEQGELIDCELTDVCCALTSWTKKATVYCAFRLFFSSCKYRQSRKTMTRSEKINEHRFPSFFFLCVCFRSAVFSLFFLFFRSLYSTGLRAFATVKKAQLRIIDIRWLCRQNQHMPQCNAERHFIPSVRAHRRTVYLRHAKPPTCAWKECCSMSCIVRVSGTDSPEGWDRNNK